MSMSRKVYSLFLLFCFFLLSCGGGGGGGSSPNTPPPKPENIVVIGGNAQVMLTWGNASENSQDNPSFESSGASITYNIYWSTTAGAVKKTGTKITGVASPYYHSGLTNGTTHFYVVTAVNQYGESAESLEVSATPRHIAPPLPPKEVVAFGFDRRVIVRWTDVEADDAGTSHNIYWSTSRGVKIVTGARIVNALSPYTHTGLTNGITYYYVITAVNQYGESIESQEKSATPDQGDTPSAPMGVRAVAGDRQATISWEAVDKATTYNIYWSTIPDVSSESGTKLTNVKSPYIHSGLTQGKTYYYIVTAVSGFGESGDSEKTSVTIPDSRKDICVAMGDSITVGDGATSNANSYVSLLSARWAKNVINEGVGGAYSSYGAAMIDVFLELYNPRYITIYYGTNDAGLLDPDLTMEHLEHIIDRAVQSGTIPVIATLGPCFNEWAWRKPYMIELNRRIRALAASKGIACADIEAALGWNSSYMATSLHPNDAGHRIIADTFYKALNP